MTAREEYEKCLVAYNRADPFATEALARNCPDYIAELQAALAEADERLATKCDDCLPKYGAWEQRAEQAEEELGRLKGMMRNDSVYASYKEARAAQQQAEAAGEDMAAENALNAAARMKAEADLAAARGEVQKLLYIADWFDEAYPRDYTKCIESYGGNDPAANIMQDLAAAREEAERLKWMLEAMWADPELDYAPTWDDYKKRLDTLWAERGGKK